MCVALHVRDHRGDRHGAGVSLMHADSDPRARPWPPAEVPKARSDGRSGHSLRTRLVVRQQNFGNSAMSCRWLLGLGRSAAGSAMSEPWGLFVLLSWEFFMSQLDAGLKPDRYRS